VPKTLSPELLDTLTIGLSKTRRSDWRKRAIEAEMAEHLGHARHEPVNHPTGNTRNGKSRKTLNGDFGELLIEIPRDRHGQFEPPIIGKPPIPLDRL
jgi:putative transposase